MASGEWRVDVVGNFGIKKGRPCGRPSHVVLTTNLIVLELPESCFQLRWQHAKRSS